MAEFRRLPTQQELQQILFMQQVTGKPTQQIINENLAKGSTVTPIPENVFQRMAGGAKTAADYVNRAGTAADVAKLFPGYTGQSQVSIPTGFNFAPKQDPVGGVIPQGLQTQQVNVGQLLQAIKPADVIGLTGAQQAYSDIGAGKAPKPLDVADTLALGATGLVGGKALLKATKGLPVGMSIKDVSGGLLKPEAPVSPIGFYSAVEQTALNIPRKQGTGQAFLNDIMKGENVKADEIKWMGLDEFLKGKQNVSRQEVQDYIANNRVDVQEVRSKIPRLPGEEMPGDKGAFLPKFGQYTLPGGENYRELLLTMPAKQLTEAEARAVLGAAPDAKLSPADIAYASRKNVDEYRSTHFDQPNILAHLRVNDRVDADGKKMLLIEEVQSDWHQAGRDKGYISAASKDAEKQFRDYSKELAAKYDLNPEQNLSMYATLKRMQPEEVAKYEQLQSAWTASKGGVPDAPFKDTWYQLALKRAIQHAAENGYDRIGLTTGSRQAERFDLSKQIDQLTYDKLPDGNYKIKFAKVNGHSFEDGGVHSAQELSNVVGKDLAKKITDDSEGSGVLRGIDLKVGGEGMKKYYDEIYPKFLDKYGKKWGARVGETTIQADGSEPIRYIDITPEMKASVTKGQPLFQAIPAIGTGGLLGAQEERQ